MGPDPLLFTAGACDATGVHAIYIKSRAERNLRSFGVDRADRSCGSNREGMVLAASSDRRVTVTSEAAIMGQR